ncbi:MAG: 3-methyl-2-oxobutanoate hydroxymethyltransferase, partial [Candidatus Aminicenantes bacterium]|nr:3-methyl-2-oxobutanoate hydroxymethyltransferase [Candidatus Aminicenantes bacterium]
AGKYCDGQILVFHDLVGYTNIYQPRFARKFADSHAVMKEALSKYIKDIEAGSFPGEAESFPLNKDIEEFLK